MLAVLVLRSAVIRSAGIRPASVRAAVLAVIGAVVLLGAAVAVVAVGTSGAVRVPMPVPAAGPTPVRWGVAGGG